MTFFENTSISSNTKNTNIFFWQAAERQDGAQKKTYNFDAVLTFR